MNEETKQKFIDFGALNYSDERMAQIIGVSETELRKMLKDGGSEAMEIGQARYEYAIDKKLMDMALGGDIKALGELNKRKRVKR